MRDEISRARGSERSKLKESDPSALHTPSKTADAWRKSLEGKPFKVRIPEFSSELDTFSFSLELPEAHTPDVEKIVLRFDKGGTREAGGYFQGTVDGTTVHFVATKTVHRAFRESTSGSLLLFVHGSQQAAFGKPSFAVDLEYSVEH